VKTSTAVTAIGRERTTSAVAIAPRRPEQEPERVVRLDVVHLADEEERGAEEEHAEQVEGLPDTRPARRPVAEVEAGGIGAGEGERQQCEPRAVAHPVPVGGDEADHADPERDPADHGEGRRRAPASLLVRVVVAGTDRRRLLCRDDPLGDPALALATQPPGK